MPEPSAIDGIDDSRAPGYRHHTLPCNPRSRELNAGKNRVHGHQTARSARRRKRFDTCLSLIGRVGSVTLPTSRPPDNPSEKIDAPAQGPPHCFSSILDEAEVIRARAYALAPSLNGHAQPERLPGPVPRPPNTITEGVPSLRFTDARAKQGLPRSSRRRPTADVSSDDFLQKTRIHPARSCRVPLLPARSQPRSSYQNSKYSLVLSYTYGAEASQGLDGAPPGACQRLAPSPIGRKTSCSSQPYRISAKTGSLSGLHPIIWPRSTYDVPIPTPRAVQFKTWWLFECAGAKPPPEWARKR